MTTLGLVLREAPTQAHLHFLTKPSCPEDPVSRVAQWPPQSLLSSGSFSSTPTTSALKMLLKGQWQTQRKKYPFPSFNLTASLTVFPALSLAPSSPRAPSLPVLPFSQATWQETEELSVCLLFPGSLFPLAQTRGPIQRSSHTTKESWGQIHERGEPVLFQGPPGPWLRCSALEQGSPSHHKKLLLAFHSA